MTVKVISDEHGDIMGIASNWESALDLAIKSKAITGSTEVWLMDEEDVITSTVEDYFGEQWKESIKNLDEHLFNILFKEIVEIDDMEVYTTE